VNHFATPGFWFHYRQLPPEIREQADRLFATLQADPRHPSLRLKRVGTFWSARIGRASVPWRGNVPRASSGSGSAPTTATSNGSRPDQSAASTTLKPARTVDLLPGEGRSYDREGACGSGSDVVFERGKTYHRRTDLHSRFGGSAQSGIAPCAKHPYIFLFTGPAGEAYGYQDGWLSDAQFAYTGEGQRGDMEMSRGNRAIQQHEADGRVLHLFEKIDRNGNCRYLGAFRYVTHQLRLGQDADGKPRSQIVFTLELVEIP
jgi:hypothetical protein